MCRSVSGGPNWEARHLEWSASALPPYVRQILARSYPGACLFAYLFICPFSPCLFLSLFLNPPFPRYICCQRHPVGLSASLAAVSSHGGSKAEGRSAHVPWDIADSRTHPGGYLRLFSSFSSSSSPSKNSRGDECSFRNPSVAPRDLRIKRNRLACDWIPYSTAGFVYSPQRSPDIPFYYKRYILKTPLIDASCCRNWLEQRIHTLSDHLKTQAQ